MNSVWACCNRFIQVLLFSGTLSVFRPMIVFSFLIRILQILTARFVFLQNKGRVMAIQNKSVPFSYVPWKFFFKFRQDYHRSLVCISFYSTTLSLFLCILQYKTSILSFPMFYIITDKATICSCTLRLFWTSSSDPCAVPTVSWRPSLWGHWPWPDWTTALCPGSSRPWIQV